MLIFLQLLGLLFSGPVVLLQSPLQEATANCFFTLDQSGLSAIGTNCPGSSTGSITFDTNIGLVGGTAPYTYDWDFDGTPFNDEFDDDGFPVLDSISYGFYILTVTDAQGCVATAGIAVEEAPQFAVGISVDSITGCEETGGINITSFAGPNGIRIYDWDLATTPFNDDLGHGNINYGLPPAEDDAEDLVTNVLGGTYYLTITVSNNPANPAYECVYRDTIIINEVMIREICPLGDISFYAGISDAGHSYHWQIDSLNGFLNLNDDIHHMGTHTSTLIISDPPSSWYGFKYRAIATAPGDTTMSQVFTLKFRLCWEGDVNMLWENPGNWNCNMLPDADTDVYINSGLPLYPKVNSNAFARSIILRPGASVDVTPGWLLNVTGGSD